MFTMPAQRMLPTSSSRARATSRSCGRWCARRSPRTIRSRSTIRATRGSACRSASPRCCRSGGARCCARAATCCSSRSGPITRGRSTSPTRSRREGWSVGVINARFAKPLDRQLILDEARGKPLVVTFEESVVTGGFGSAVLEAVEEARLADPASLDPGQHHRHPRRPVRGPRRRSTDLRRLIRLDVPGLAARSSETIAQLGITAGRRSAQSRSACGAAPAAAGVRPR